MEYLASRLYKSEPIPIELVSQHWQQLAQEIEHIDSSTLRVWQTIQVIHEDRDGKRVYINGQRQPFVTVAIVSSCYLRVEQDSHGTTFTMVASEKEALDSVRSLIESIYAPVQSERLEAFLQQNQELPVLAARLYEPDREEEVFLTYGEPVALSNVVNNGSASELISFSAAVDIVTASLSVRILFISSIDQQAGFSVETDLQDERVLINRLFILVDRTFKGKLHW